MGARDGTSEVEVAHRVGGIEAATLLARQRSGSQFDPALADLLCSQAEGILGDLDGVNTWRAVIEGEPSLTRVLGADEFDAALAAVANFVDLKSPCKPGHSVAVSELAAGAGGLLGLTEGEVRALRRAALVYGFGRLGVSNPI